jgi:hypothetical protein
MPLAEAYRPGYGEPALVQGEAPPGFQELPSFRECLLHKLRLIIRMAGSQTKAADALDMNGSALRRWLTGDGSPDSFRQSAIDDCYRVAVEKLRLTEQRQNVVRTRDRLRKRRKAVLNSVDGVC